MSNREIIESDAHLWLQEYQQQIGDSLVTSLPDISEFKNRDLDKWKKWFTDTAHLVLSKIPDDGVAIFYQSDIKIGGIWIDKAYLIQKAAEKLGFHLHFHKIMCRVPPETPSFGRPTYSHLLAFSRYEPKISDHPLPDILTDIGEKTWERGMGLLACKFVAEYLKKETTTKRVINPFCGQGSVVAMMDAYGFHAIGIDRSQNCTESAKKLQVDLENSRWII